jgi:hypothetical protein
MNDNKKPVDYGPSTYNFDFDFNFQLTFWDYCQLAIYSLFIFPLFFLWHVALSPAVSRLKRVASRENSMAGQDHHFPLGSACSWPREVHL